MPPKAQKPITKPPHEFDEDEIKVKYFAYLHGWCDAGGGKTVFTNQRQSWKSIDFVRTKFFARYLPLLKENMRELIAAEWLIEFMELRNKE